MCNRCVICGDPIPEDRQVCPICEDKAPQEVKPHDPD